MARVTITIEDVDEPGKNPLSIAVVGNPPIVAKEMAHGTLAQKLAGCMLQNTQRQLATQVALGLLDENGEKKV